MTRSEASLSEAASDVPSNNPVVRELNSYMRSARNDSSRVSHSLRISMSRSGVGAITPDYLEPPLLARGLGLGLLRGEGDRGGEIAQLLDGALQAGGDLLDAGLGEAGACLGDVSAGPYHDDDLHLGDAPLEALGEVAGLHGSVRRDCRDANQPCAALGDLLDDLGGEDRMADDLRGEVGRRKDPCERKAGQMVGLVLRADDAQRRGDASSRRLGDRANGRLA